MPGVEPVKRVTIAWAPALPRGGRVGNHPPWKKSGWAMPILEIPTVVSKLAGNSLSIKVWW